MVEFEVTTYFFDSHNSRDREVNMPSRVPEGCLTHFLDLEARAILAGAVRVVVLITGAAVILGLSDWTRTFSVGEIASVRFNSGIPIATLALALALISIYDASADTYLHTRHALSGVGLCVSALALGGCEILLCASISASVAFSMFAVEPLGTYREVLELLTMAVLVAIQNACAFVDDRFGPGHYPTAIFATAGLILGAVSRNANTLENAMTWTVACLGTIAWFEHILKE